MRIVPAALVDRLPIDWWRPDNIHFFRSHGLHFCVANGAEHSVRTTEWDSNEVGRGRKLVPVGCWDETEHNGGDWALATPAEVGEGRRRESDVAERDGAALTGR